MLFKITMILWNIMALITTISALSYFVASLQWSGFFDAP